MNYDKQFYVYLLASSLYGVLYIGVTSNLIKRIWEHKTGVTEGFTKKYGVKTLVYYEIHANAESAITREKCLKRWKRAWKVDLIDSVNPQWEDIYPSLTTSGDAA